MVMAMVPILFSMAWNELVQRFVIICRSWSGSMRIAPIFSEILVLISTDEGRAALKRFNASFVTADGEMAVALAVCLFWRLKSSIWKISFFARSQLSSIFPVYPTAF